MKTNLRGKIREFIQSEEGKVGIKAPLTLGIATGSVLLAQAVVGTTAEAATCNADEECQPKKCINVRCRPMSNGGESCWGECG